MITRTLRRILTLALLAPAACAVLGAPSRVRTGLLYTAGSPRYDAYFGAVHAQQVAVTNWTEERKTARKPLIDALKLSSDADDSAIAQSTKDRLSSGVLRLEVQGTDVHVVEAAASHHDATHDVFVAVEQAAHAEVARSNKLADVPVRASALAKTGHELEARLGEDFAGAGQKPFDVQEELHASYDVLQVIVEGAQKERRAADQFVAELARAVSTGSEIPVSPAPAKTKAAPPVPVAPKAEPQPHSTPRPAPKPAPPPPAPPAPAAHGPEPVAAAPKSATHTAPKPAKPEASEVFNP